MPSNMAAVTIWRIDALLWTGEEMHAKPLHLMTLRYWLSFFLAMFQRVGILPAYCGHLSLSYEVIPPQTPTMPYILYSLTKCKIQLRSRVPISKCRKLVTHSQALWQLHAHLWFDAVPEVERPFHHEESWLVQFHVRHGCQQIEVCVRMHQLQSQGQQNMPDYSGRTQEGFTVQFQQSKNSSYDAETLI